MTLIVEDGTGLADADSYVDIADIDDYAARFGKAAWASVTSSVDKEIKARLATQFVDNKYPIGGVSLTADQALMFPVTSLYVRGHHVTGIPRQLKDAVCELAIIAVNTDLTDSVAARTYTFRKVKVGDVEKTERFETDDTQNVFRTVELILRPLLSAEIGTGVRQLRMVRA